MRLTKNDLSPDQREAYSGILTWLNRGTETKQTITFAGYAGTGKTTVTCVLAHELPRPLAFCAYTGKAASVLARKLAEHGIETTPVLTDEDEIENRPYCGTIHGLVYRPCPVCRPREATYGHTLTGNCRTVKDEVCTEHGSPRGRCVDCDRCQGCDPPPPPPRRKGRCGNCGSFGFVQRTDLDRNYKLIVCDEASMIGNDMLDSMLSFGIPILAVGDHGQLKPVKGTGSLMQYPDIRLEKIHRQAEGNPIIALSKYIRETGALTDRFCDGQHVGIYSDQRLHDFINRSYPPGRSADELLQSAIITWTNRTRCALNWQIRQSLGRELLSLDAAPKGWSELGVHGSPPSPGDVVICLKNKPPIYNGMRGILVGDAVESEEDDKRPKHLATVDFPEDHTMDDEAAMSALQFYFKDKIDDDTAYEHGVAPVASLGDLYDYGYALTCHKMQGSQLPKVAVVIERGMQKVLGPETTTRWLYTAVTRSSDKLVIFR